MHKAVQKASHNLESTVLGT